MTFEVLRKMFKYLESRSKQVLSFHIDFELLLLEILQLDENKKIVKVEQFFDPAQLLGPLVKGPKLDDSTEKGKELSSCPVLKHLG